VKAKSATRAMLAWWAAVGVDRADLAVRRTDDSFAWHLDRPLDDLPLPWARAENVGECDVYIRPARCGEWPLLFLDDVETRQARAIAAKYAAIVVQTSPAGGCHVWLACDRPLGEESRARAQRWLAQRIDADPASVSGEHLGRLAGLKNWKRGGTWVNIVATSAPAGRRWDPTPALTGSADDGVGLVAGPQHRSRRRSSGRDRSESGREWGLVCSALEAGYCPDVVCRRLLARAAPRKGRHAEAYARRTVERAIAHVSAETSRIAVG